MKITSASLRALLLLTVTTFLASGCLIAEKKEYVFKVNKDGSGSGTIRFVNLVSQDDEEQDVSFKDFAELVTDYVQGDKFQDDNPQFLVTDKKLYEQDGMLIGEVSFTFSSWDSAGFFRTNDCDCCPTFYYFEAVNNETYESSNGEYLGENGKLPLIVFPSETKEFTFTTTFLTDLSGTHSLLEHYKSWKK
jgi:hypothetical protein